MNDIDLRLGCVRIGSENLAKSDVPVTNEFVLEYAEQLFDYIWSGPAVKKAA